MNDPALSSLRIGLIGAGGIVRDRHLPGLKAIPGVEIIGVCNSTFESSARFCKEHLPQATPFANWADLLALEVLDVVWIGTPPYLHAPLTISALEAGKHVFCQARMAMNLMEAHEMYETAKRYPDRVTMLCPPPHGMKGDRTMRRLLAEKRIGDPVHLHLRSFSDAWIRPESPAHWRQREELSGLNVMSLGIYAEVLDRWLGPIRSVQSDRTILHAVRGDYQVRVPDWTALICQFESGAKGVLEFSGVATAAPTDQLTIYGSEGVLVYDFGTDTILHAARGEKTLQEISIPANEQRSWQVESDFISAVRSGGSLIPRPSFADGVRYMGVVQAAYDSALTKSETLVAG